LRLILALLRRLGLIRLSRGAIRSLLMRLFLSMLLDALLFNALLFNALLLDAWRRDISLAGFRPITLL
jgi:hypothetical protein